MLFLLKVTEVMKEGSPIPYLINAQMRIRKEIPVPVSCNFQINSINLDFHTLFHFLRTIFYMYSI